MHWALLLGCTAESVQHLLKFPSHTNHHGPSFKCVPPPAAGMGPGTCTHHKHLGTFLWSDKFRELQLWGCGPMFILVSGIFFCVIVNVSLCPILRTSLGGGWYEDSRMTGWETEAQELRASPTPGTWGVVEWGGVSLAMGPGQAWFLCKPVIETYEAHTAFPSPLPIIGQIPCAQHWPLPPWYRPARIWALACV